MAKYTHPISLGNVNRLPARVTDANGPASEASTDSAFESPEAEEQETTKH